MTAKDGFLSVFEFVSCLLIYMLTTVGIHEFLHLSALRGLGGDGYIVLLPFGGAGVHLTQNIPAGSSDLLFLLSGGIGVFLIYALFALWSFKDQNYEELAAILPVALVQLFYGVYEGAFINTLSETAYNSYSGLPMVLGFGLGLVFPVKYRGKWNLMFYALVCEFMYQFDRKHESNPFIGGD